MAGSMSTDRIYRVVGTEAGLLVAGHHDEMLNAYVIDLEFERGR